MLPPTLSQSARIHLVTNGSAVYRALLSPHTVRVVAASIAMKVSPTLRNNSRSCWGWSRLDRANARANHAYMRVTHRIVKVRMIKAASDRLWLGRLGTRSPFGWRLSSSWGPRDVHEDRSTEQNHNDQSRPDAREEDPFEVSDREKRWRKREEELRRWVTENPYEAIFGYSNRLGRFGQKGGLFNAFRAREPSEAMREVMRDAESAAESGVQTPNTSSEAAKEPNNQSLFSGASTAPAKATKMGHGSSTPRNATVLTEAPLVYDPISNRMVPKTGEFSHYGQELDVGSKVPTKDYDGATIPEPTPPTLKLDTASDKARSESLANSIARADVGETVAESRQPGIEESWWLQREGFLDSIPQPGQSLPSNGPASSDEIHRLTTQAFNHESPIIEEITSNAGSNEGQDQRGASVIPTGTVQNEYTKYKDRRLRALDEASPGGQERADLQRLTSRRSEKRQQIARRAKLERNFDKLPAAGQEVPEVLTWKNARSKNESAQEPTEEDVLALSALGSLGFGQGLETALDRHIARKAATSTGLKTSLQRHSKSLGESSESTQQSHDKAAPPVRDHEPCGYDHSRESQKLPNVEEPKVMPSQESKEILQTQLDEGLISQTPIIEDDTAKKTLLKVKKSAKPAPRIAEDEEPDFASLDGSLSVELDNEHTSSTRKADEMSIKEEKRDDVKVIRTAELSLTPEIPTYFILSTSQKMGGDVFWITTDPSKKAHQEAGELAAIVKRFGNFSRALSHLLRREYGTNGLELFSRKHNVLVLRTKASEQAPIVEEMPLRSPSPSQVTGRPTETSAAEKDSQDEPTITAEAIPVQQADTLPESDPVLPLVREVKAAAEIDRAEERENVKELDNETEEEHRKKTEEFKKAEELRRAAELKMIEDHDTLEDLVRVEDLKPFSSPKAPKASAEPSLPPASENITSRNPIWMKYRRRAIERKQQREEATRSSSRRASGNQSSPAATIPPPISTIPEFRRSTTPPNPESSPIPLNIPTVGDELSSPAISQRTFKTRRTRRFWLFLRRFATMFGFSAAVLYVAGLIMQYRGEKQRSGAFGAGGVRRGMVFDEDARRKSREG